MIKRIMLWILVIVILATAVNAALTDDLVNRWTFDAENTTGTDYLDSVGSLKFQINGADADQKPLGTLTGNSTKFVTVNSDFLNATRPNYLDVTDSWTISMVVNVTTVAAGQGQFMISSDGANDRWTLGRNGNSLIFVRYDGASVPKSCDVIAVGEHHLWVNMSSSRHDFYLDDTQCTGATANNVGVAGFQLGAGVATRFSNVFMDEVCVWDAVKSEADRTTMFNGGNYDTCTVPVIPGSANATNETIQSAFERNQDSTVLVSSPIYSTLFSSTFTTSNSTQAYFSGNIPIANPVSSNTADCRLLINNSVLNSNQSRSLTAGDNASLQIMTTNTTLDVGGHSVELQCRRIGGGNYNVVNSSVIGHVMIDGNSNPLNYFASDEVGNALGASFVQEFDINFTASSLKTNGTIEKYLVVETNDVLSYTSNDNISTYVAVNGSKCMAYTREGTTGSTGSSSLGCVFPNINNNTDYNVQIFSKGTGSINRKINIFEGNYRPTKINQTSLNQSTVLTGGEVTRLEIDKPNAGSFNIFAKAIIPISSDGGGDTASFNISLSDGKTSEVITRTVNGRGILMVQHMFTSLSAGQFNVSLNGACTTSCNIEDGLFMVYVTDDITINPFIYNLKALDNLTNNTITEFTAIVNNITFSTDDGNMELPITNDLVDILVNSSIYFENSTQNYNTSDGDLNISMIKWTEINASSLGTPILTFKINFSNTTFSTTSGVTHIPLFDQVAEVTIFDASQGGNDFAKKTQNLTAAKFLKLHTFNLLPSNSFFLTVLDEQTRIIIDDRNITIKFISDLEASNFTTDNGTLFESAFMPSEIEIRYDAPDYSERSFFHFMTNQSFNNITLYLLNESESNLIIATHIDASGGFVEGVTSILKRGYIIGGVQVFETVEMDKTDFGGEAVFSVELNDKDYKWLVVDNVENNTVLFTSNPAEITSTTIEFTLNILADPLATFNLISGDGLSNMITTAPNYDNVSKTWNASFMITQSNVYQQVCLQVKQITDFGYVIVNETCTTSNDASLSVGYDNEQRGSVATLLLRKDGQADIPLSIRSFNPSEIWRSFGSTGLFLTLWLVTTIGLALINTPATLIIGGSVGLLSAIMLGFVGLSWLAFVPIMITGGILMFKMRGVN